MKQLHSCLLSGLRIQSKYVSNKTSISSSKMVQAMNEQEARVINLQKDLLSASTEELRSQIQLQLRKEMEVLDERTLLVHILSPLNAGSRLHRRYAKPSARLARVFPLSFCDFSSIHEAQQASAVDALSSSSLFFIGDLTSVLEDRDPLAPRFFDADARTQSDLSELDRKNRSKYPAVAGSSDDSEHESLASVDESAPGRNGRDLSAFPAIDACAMDPSLVLPVAHVSIAVRSDILQFVFFE